MSDRVKKREVVRIRDKLEELPVEQRVVVVAHYYDGLTICEIAGLLECSESRVRMYLRCAEGTLDRKMPFGSRGMTSTVLYSAAEVLLTSKAYTMTVRTAKALYKEICSSLEWDKKKIL